MDSTARPAPIQFRPAPALAADLAARAADRLSANQAAARDLERYYHLLRAELRAVDLAPGEAALICDAANGTLWEPHTLRLLWAEVADALVDGLAAKRGVDGPALVARLRALTPTQAAAVADAAERYWLAPGDDLDATLRAVGLVRGGR